MMVDTIQGISFFVLLLALYWRDHEVTKRLNLLEKK